MVLRHAPLSRDAGFWNVRNSSPRFPYTPPGADMLPASCGQTTGLPAGDFLPCSRSIQGPLDPHPYSAVPHGGPRPVAVIHTYIRKPPGPTAMPRHPTSTARHHLPSLPGSTGVSCASGRRSVIPTTLPSGSSPRLSATRATPSRAPIWRAARYHGHESVTPAEGQPLTTG
jgi:hypothetical protein